MRLYRLLLHLYPADFREHFGREMCQVLAGRMRHEPLAWISACLAVLFHAPAEHLSILTRDLRQAGRMLFREKLTAGAAILVMALGIGSTTAIFTLINGAVLRPLPFNDPARLVYVQESGAKKASGAVAYPNYLDLRDRNHSLESLALFTEDTALLQIDGAVERIPSASGTASLFPVLGVQPLAGRVFTADEDRVHGPSVALISEDLWQRHPRLLDRTVKLDGVETRVIGVMPRGFHFPSRAQLWTPQQIDPRNNSRTDHWLEAVGRLKPGVSLRQAEAELRALMAQILAEHPNESYGQTVALSTFADHASRRLRPLLVVQLGAAAFVLLIACANLASLLLVKAAARAREMAVRGALGASRSRLVRAFVTESALLGAIGSAAGMLLAWALVPTLTAMLPEGIPPRWVAFTPDWRIALFVAMVTGGCAIVAGLVPALSGSRPNVLESLKGGGRSTSGKRSRRLLESLVAAEIAASVLLLAGAGLMLRTQLNLQNRDTGYRTTNLTTFQVTPAEKESEVAAAQRVTRIRERLAALPGVVSTAGTSAVPLLDAWGRSFYPENAASTLQQAPLVQRTIVTPDYLGTMGIRLIEGRDFTDRDTLTLIIDQALARRYWPNESAIGERVRFSATEPWHTVIGVAAVAYNNSLRELTRNGIYLPYGEFNLHSLAYVVRSTQPLSEAALRSIEPNVAVSRILTMRQIFDRVLWQERFFATLAVSFAGIALLMALTGLYGVIAYSVSRRTHEMGIRMALGATAPQIRALVLRQTAPIILTGLALGTLAAAFTPLPDNLLYGVERHDPATLCSVATLLALSALAAVAIPARRATQVDPIAALRRE